MDGGSVDGGVRGVVDRVDVDRVGRRVLLLAVLVRSNYKMIGDA